MQGRSAVEQDGMSTRDFIENVPNLRGLAFNHLLCAPHGMDVAQVFKAPNNERLEQNERHFLRQTALMQLQLRSDHDDRAARVIDPLAEQVLAESSTFALEHVGK